MIAAAVDAFEAAEAYYANGANLTGHVEGVHSSRSVDQERAITFLDHDDLFTAEPQNENLVVPELGIGAGPPNALVGQGFVGKTIMAMSLGLSVALGRLVWGRYRVRQGVWVHLDYEQGRRETKRRVQRLAFGFGVGAEELDGRLRVAVYPSINLTTPDAVRYYAEAMKDAAVVTIDALKGVTPGVEENSSSMRDYMRTLSVASEETGCAVILIHHAGKFDGKKARKEMGRGSSAIYDECQSMFVVTGEKDEDERVTHEKDREIGETVPEFRVRFEDVPDYGEEDDDVSLDEYDPRRGLRVVVAEPEGSVATERITRFLRNVGMYQGSRTSLLGQIGMNRSEFYRALGALEEAGRVHVEGRSAKDGRPNGRITLVEDADAK